MPRYSRCPRRPLVGLRGGNEFPVLIRKTEPKPLRVYMADTSGDLDNPFGHWPLANQQMNAALKYMGYDVRFDWAEGGGHNADFGGTSDNPCDGLRGCQ